VQFEVVVLSLKCVLGRSVEVELKRLVSTESAGGIPYVEVSIGISCLNGISVVQGPDVLEAIGSEQLDVI
jgi:hypothetical protein